MGSVETSQPKLSVDKPKVKAKGGLGSCFGKPKEPSVDIEHKPISADLEVDPNLEGDISVTAPSVSGDVKTPKGKVKTKSAGLGSCFGKPKVPKGEVDVKSPSIDADVSGTTARVEGEIE